MNVNELRIGNYIKTIYDNHIYDVCEIRKSVLEIDSKSGNKHIHSISFDSCEPIPLTEEWLLKFGFYKRGQWYKKEGCHILGWVWNGVYIGMNRDYSINYMFVHELQNLHFALTGKELELKEEIL